MQAVRSFREGFCLKTPEVLMHVAIPACWTWKLLTQTDPWNFLLVASCYQEALGIVLKTARKRNTVH
jgi:hypothetical protein